MLRSKGLFERCCGVNEDILSSRLGLMSYSDSIRSEISKNNTYECIRNLEYKIREVNES